MNTLIFRTIAPFLTALMLVFSVFILWRGHDSSGGGFIGGLIAASSVAVYSLAAGIKDTRKALGVDPLTISGAGVIIAVFSGLLSFPAGTTFLTGLRWYPEIAGSVLKLSTPLMFDIGVWFVVLGSVSSIILALEQTEDR